MKAPNRRPPHHPRARKLIVLTLALLVAVLVPAFAGAAPAGEPRTASAEPATLRLDLGRITPLALDPGDTLTVRGSLTNTAETAATGLTIGLRVRTEPVAARGQLGSIAAGAEPDAPLTAVRKARAEVAPIPPGQARPWTVSVPVNALDLPGNGVYLLGVEVLGAGAAERPTRLTGLTTFLPYLPDRDSYAPTELSWVWPLAAVPARDAHGAFLGTADLGAALAPGGRLTDLATAPDAAPVTWLVDPALLEAVAARTERYRVRAPDGEGTDAVEPDPAAAAWLTGLRERLTGQPVAALPYGDPDVVALTRHDHTDALDDALVRSRAVTTALLGQESDTRVAWPPGGFATEQALAVARRAGARTVVLSSEAVATARPLTYTPTGRARVPAGDGRSLEALLFDQPLADILGGDLATPGAAALARQRFLAETAMITLERPNQPRAVLVAPPHRWAPPPGWAADLLTATRQVPWVSTVGLSTLSQTPDVPEYRGADLRYPEEIADRELGRGFVRQIREGARTARSVERILADPDEPGGLATTHSGALLRAASAAWRAAPDPGAAYLAHVLDTIDEDASEVRIIGREHVTLSDSRGQLPVTVSNGLDAAIRVQVEADPQIAARLQVAEPDVLTVGPGRKQTVRIDAEANVNGITRVDLQLLDANGRPFGEPRQIRVNVTNYGSVALIVLIAGSGLLFAAALVRNIRRIRRRVRAGGTRDADQAPQPSGKAGAEPPVGTDVRAQA